MYGRIGGEIEIEMSFSHGYITTGQNVLRRGQSCLNTLCGLLRQRIEVECKKSLVGKSSSTEQKARVSEKMRPAECLQIISGYLCGYTVYISWANAMSLFCCGHQSPATNKNKSTPSFASMYMQ